MSGPLRRVHARRLGLLLLDELDVDGHLDLVALDDGLQHGTMLLGQRFIHKREYAICY